MVLDDVPLFAGSPHVWSCFCVVVAKFDYRPYGFALRFMSMYVAGDVFPGDVSAMFGFVVVVFTF